MRKKKIYVADDDVNILELMHTILELQGYEVTTSPDGLSLQTLTETPDMVFLDIAMSGSDGSEICYQYKRNPGTSDVPVVLVSANVNLQEIADNCGANDVLPKPFDIRTVVELARKYTITGKK
ncbi:MAG: response regulator [Chitinophagaceae bacterium]|nr:response regulator [Chitinophagaceae bacterium]